MICHTKQRTSKEQGKRCPPKTPPNYVPTCMYMYMLQWLHLYFAGVLVYSSSCFSLFVYLPLRCFLYTDPVIHGQTDIHGVWVFSFVSSFIASVDSEYYMYMVYYFKQFDDGKMTKWKWEFRENINDPHKIYMQLSLMLWTKWKVIKNFQWKYQLSGKWVLDVYNRKYHLSYKIFHV